MKGRVWGERIYLSKCQLCLFNRYFQGLKNFPISIGEACLYYPLNVYCMLMPVKLNDGQWTRSSLFPHVLLAAFPGQGLIKALGKGVAVIFKEGADIVIHWISTWAISSLMTHSFTEEAFSGHITRISFESPSLLASGMCWMDHPQLQGMGPNVFKLILQFLKDNVWLRVGHVLLMREPQSSL